MPGPVREPNPDDDFDLREVKIPMRDGTELNTLILLSKARKTPAPILLLRTPYDAGRYVHFRQRAALHAVLGPGYAELEGYIFAFQDLRGRFGSAGHFEINRPLRGPLNASATDEATDAWDTVDWLTKNLPESNGRVGIYGTSYEGWATLVALLDPHPALHAAVPVNPLVDGWKGDDWFHHGAFRQAYAFEYVHAMESNPNGSTPFAFAHYDTFDWWLKAGSPADVGRRYLNPERHRFWTTLMQNPEYSTVWQQNALDGMLQKSKARQVPTLVVHGWFDQEDAYGAPAAYAALHARAIANPASDIRFIAGPWYHGQNWLASPPSGVLAWSEDPARYFRRELLAPFLRHHLRGAPRPAGAAVVVFDTGLRHWEPSDSWPAPTGGQSRCLYLHASGALSWEPPVGSADVGRSYISDPQKPVPYRPRPVRRVFHDELDPDAWRTWLMGDQRFVDGRPDVLSYVSEPFETPIRLRGTVTVHLHASTTGSDADWVVKLIDVYPDFDTSEPRMSGYQLMLSGDIFRARYRVSTQKPEPLTPNRPLEYVFELPHLNHSVLEHHRLMVQVQSTWFPLYDRNPQRFVSSLMDARESDYTSATHTVHSSRAHPSHIELWVEAPAEPDGRGDG